MKYINLKKKSSVYFKNKLRMMLMNEYYIFKDKMYFLELYNLIFIL